MATQLTGSVEILRIYELLEKNLSPSELANYKIAIDYEGDTDTKMIPLDKLRDILVSTGLWNDRDGYDASTNLFPSTGGSGISNSILRANVFYITVAGTLGGTPVTPGMLLFAKTDIPGQTAGNWLIIGSSNFDMAGSIHGATNKTTPVNADEFVIWNSVDGLLNRLSWANIKATLKTYFEALALVFTDEITFNKTVIQPAYSNTFSSSLTINFSLGNIQYVAITGTISITLSNLREGVSMLILTNDSTAGRAVTIDSTFGTKTDNSGTHLTGANKVNIYTIMKYGSVIKYTIETSS